MTWPSVEVAKTAKEIKVTAELPGIDEKDVRVELSNNVLTIDGEKKSEIEPCAAARGTPNRDRRRGLRLADLPLISGRAARRPASRQWARSRLSRCKKIEQHSVSRPDMHPRLR